MEHWLIRQFDPFTNTILRWWNVYLIKFNLSVVQYGKICISQLLAFEILALSSLNLCFRFFTIDLFNDCYIFLILSIVFFIRNLILHCYFYQARWELSRSHRDILSAQMCLINHLFPPDLIKHLLPGPVPKLTSAPSD